MGVQWMNFVNRDSDLFKSPFKTPDKCTEKKIYEVKTTHMSKEEIDKKYPNIKPYPKPQCYDILYDHDKASERVKKAWKNRKKKAAELKEVNGL
jgi:hypothetical protein